MYKPPHVLSHKSAWQCHDVFIWCTASHRLALGWHVRNDSPITVSTVYHWITSAVEAWYHGYGWEEAESYSLFPIKVQPNDVLTYSEIIVPGDYGLYAIGDLRLYYFFQPTHLFSGMEHVVKANSPGLSAKALLTPSIIQQALNRDCQCLFSGAVPSCDSDMLSATWIFPPFLGHKAST
ncbi:hypothetical protein P691DRAFT_796025 [Macrolepiota fuliginosa MF-IS2]|uniref:Uncharacterized protein n=1 Tax=Macrolepiota fuliginosa MF-IS2 TaxID=1400762 RepID=A0A9P5X4S4_9AGAR|nr:hypothetical protein P691DRAFT_796025 [Macrolepiota fuliginosa MF-IS2]